MKLDIKMNYNPDDFVKDKAYLEARNKPYLVAYMKQRFPKNSGDIRVTPLKITKSYISNMSNIYIKMPKYLGIDMGNQQLNINKYLLEMHNLERFANLNETAGLWFWLKKGKMMYKALHPSEYYFVRDDDGDIAGALVVSGYREKARATEQSTNTYLKNNVDFVLESPIISDYIAIFKYYTSNLVYSVDASSWSEALQSDLWVESGSYEIMPFTEFQRADIPNKNDLIDTENETVAGGAYSLYTIFLAMLKKFGMTGDMTDGDFQDVIDNFGAGSVFFNTPTGTQLSTLDTGNVQNNLDYKAYVANDLKFLAKGEGVDENGLFPDSKVQTGIAKRLDMTNIAPIRDEKIVQMRVFEYENWNKINEFINAGIPESIVYAPLNFIDPVEEIEILNKKIDGFLKLVDKAMLSPEEALSRILDIPIEEASTFISKAKQLQRQDVESFKNDLQALKMNQVVDNEQE